jgi:hypothetical protein
LKAEKPVAPQQAMLSKLATSLLTAKHARLMQLRACTEADVKQLNVQPQWEGFKIPYFDLDGRLRQDGFFRFRFTVDHPSRGWGSTAVTEKPRRYAQPLNSGCAVYFPPTIIGCTWRAVANDPAIPVVITEGELKSACASSLGAPTMGLGGVNNWRTATMARNELLPELEEFKWHLRTVIILFDSNINRNPNVACAASMLASVLTMRGAIVKLTHPPVNTEDTDKHGLGVDDWLYQLPKDVNKADALTKLLAEAPDVDGAAALHAVNLELARVVASKDYVRLVDGRRITKRELVEETEYGGRTYNVDMIVNNQVVKKAVNTIKTWLTWRYCHELKSYVYRPGHPRLTTDGCYNTWKGWGIEPQPGDVTPFLELLDHLLGNATPSERRWFLQWLAAPLQEPGLKMRNGVVLWGGVTGTGKTLVGQTMRRIYGDNWGVLETKHFHSNFNSYVVGKQFILGDEISVTEKRSVSERLKSMLTQEQVLVEEKYQIPYVVEDHANYYFTSNYPDAFYVEEDDRRFFIHEVTAAPLITTWRDRYFAWLEQGGAAALFDHLLRVSLTGFDAFERPPLTAAKVDMIQIGVSDVRRWIEDVKLDPATALGRPKEEPACYLTTVGRLVSKYRAETDRPMDAAWMGKELAKAGIRKAAKGAPNVIVDGRKTRVHIIGASPEWVALLQAMSVKEIEILMAGAPPVPPRKFEEQRARVN